MHGPGMIYYGQGEFFGPAMNFADLGKEIKNKFRNYLNKRKGYQLTKTTEDFTVCFLKF